MKYQLTVTYADGTTTTSTVKGFKRLSAAIDKAWKTRGFTGYRVDGVK
jgi:hypothetical protein